MILQFICIYNLYGYLLSFSLYNLTINLTIFVSGKETEANDD